MNRTLKLVSAAVFATYAVLAYAQAPTPVSAQAVTQATAASADDALVQRGAYLAKVGDCVACHSAPRGKPFAGGLPMTTPMGAIYTTNITPDPETGIGTYTEEDFSRALRRTATTCTRRCPIRHTQRSTTTIRAGDAPESD